MSTIAIILLASVLPAAHAQDPQTSKGSDKARALLEQVSGEPVPAAPASVRPQPVAMPMMHHHPMAGREALPPVGPPDACGRVTDLDYFNEKREDCDEPSNVTRVVNKEDGLLPDLRAVVPTDLVLCRKGKRELLWFSSGIANVGDGPLQIRPGKRTKDRPAQAAWIEQDALTDLREAVQWIVTKKGQVADKAVVGLFGWHAIHNHYHTDAMALYQVRKDGPDGELVSRGRKISFCLDDSYAHGAGGVPPARRSYDQWCHYPQGVGPGWVDEYPFGVAGQYVDVTSAPEGDYYLLVTVNPDKKIRQKTDASSTAWLKFTLKRPTKGLPVAEATAEHSECDGPGLCGEISPEKRGAHFWINMAAPKTPAARLRYLRSQGFCN